MLRLPSRSEAGAGFKQTISQPSPSESLPGEQDYPLLPGPGLAPAPVSRPRVPARLLCPWDFPGKNTRVACHFLLQEIFLTQGFKLHLLCLMQWQLIL